MKVKDKFNSMMDTIEKMVFLEEDLRAAKIKEKVTRQLGLSPRDLNTIFTFLSNCSLNEYIKERQIMAAYKLLIQMPIFKIDIAISVSGYANHSSFDKAFKSRFGITPQEAFNKKDPSKLSEQLTWDMVSNGVNLLEIPATKNNTEKKKYGISIKRYELIRKIIELQALYEFDDTQSNIAYSIAKEFKVKLSKAFDFVDDYCVYLDYISGQSDSSEEEMTALFMASKEIAYIFFNVINEIGTAVNLVGEIKALGHNPMEFDIEFLKIFVNEDTLTFNEFLELAKKYEETHGSIDNYFEEFLSKIKFGYDIEDAMYEDDYDLLAETTEVEPMNFEEEFNESFQKWVDEETNYNNDDKIAEDYDEDSSFYEDGNLFDDFK